MILVVWIENLTFKNEYKNPLFSAIYVSQLSDDFNYMSDFVLQGIDLEDSEYVDEEIIIKRWSDAIKTVYEAFGEERRKIFVFATVHTKNVFHIMKGRTNKKLHSTHNGSLDTIIDWKERNYESNEAIEKMITLLKETKLAYYIENGIITSNGLVNKESVKKKTKECKRPKIANNAAYFGDAESKVFHRKDCMHIQEIENKNLVQFDYKFKGKKWIPCKSCMGDFFSVTTLNDPQVLLHLATQKKKASSQLREEHLFSLCRKYGMHYERKKGITYITTIAGEWYYFQRKGREITLMHRNYRDEEEGGKSLDFFHAQARQFGSQVQIINYIHRHDSYMKLCLLEDAYIEKYLRSEEM